MTRNGTVYLVGAGPGDPGLLTLRGAQLLAEAQVVAFDELVAPEILDRIPPTAERLPVGRRAGHCPSPPIHPDIVERALAGKDVVRLKAGDPLIFGRGGEEAAALREAGIRFEIVPGISAALGAGAYAGIPLTHRHFSSAVTLVTGHRAATGAPQVDWSALARTGGTIALYMATLDLRDKLARLVAGGLPPATPAALVLSATTPRQRVVVGTVGTLADLVPDRGGDPALVLVGEVARLHDELTWFESRPLHGRTVLVARTRPGPSNVAAPLRELGACVIEAPEVVAGPPTETADLDAALDRMGECGGLVFAGSPAVAAWLDRMRQRGIDRRSVPAVPIWALDSGAACALEDGGFVPAGSLAGFTDSVRTQDWGDSLRGRRVLVLAHEQASEGLLADLAAQGSHPEPVAAYSLDYRWPRLSFRPELLVVSSSAGARLVLGRPEFRGIPVLAIGPQTAAAAEEAGAAVERVAGGGLPGLVDRAVAFLRRTPAPVPN